MHGNKLLGIYPCSSILRRKSRVKNAAKSREEEIWYFWTIDLIEMSFKWFIFMVIGFVYMYCIWFPFFEEKLIYNNWEF